MEPAGVCVCVCVCVCVSVHLFKLGAASDDVFYIISTEEEATGMFSHLWTDYGHNLIPLP